MAWLDKASGQDIIRFVTSFKEAMILQQILGIVLITGAVALISVAQENDNHQSADQKSAILGIQDTRNKENPDLFKTETYIATSQYQSTAELIKDQKIVVFPEDIIKVFPDPQFRVGFVLNITRALPVKLIDGKREAIYRTFKATIRELLAEKQIELGDKDKIDPELDKPLVKDMTITIVRVDEVEIKIKKTIEFETRYQDDAELDKGLTKVIEPGAVGEKELTYKVRRENGVEVKRDLTNTQVLKKPSPKIIARGTKEVIYGVGKATFYPAPSMSAAHNNLPRGTMVEVTNLENGKKIIVRINGGGIYGDAIIDLSKDAFTELTNLSMDEIYIKGIVRVKLARP